MGLPILDSSDPSTKYNPAIFVVCRTTASITLSGTQTIDGVAVNIGDAVLVNNQATASQNGPYIVQSGSWTRHPRMTTQAQLQQTQVFVTAGTSYKGFTYMCGSGGTISVGTTNLSWNVVPVYGNSLQYALLANSAVGGFLGHSGTSSSSIVMISSSTQYHVPQIGASSALSFGYLTAANLQNSVQAAASTALTL